MTQCIVYNIVHRNDEWHVLKDGAAETQGRFKSKPDAIERGKMLAMGEEVGRLRITLTDGSIQSEMSFGSDPIDLEGVAARGS